MPPLPLQEGMDTPAATEPVAPPQEEGTTQEGMQDNAAPIADDDVSTDKAKLQLLRDELEQTRGSLDADFIKEFQTSLTPEEQELQFGDPVAFLSLYEQKKQAFLEERINAKESAISELEATIQHKEETAAYKSAMAEFLKNHPDVTKEALRDFFYNDLPPRKQKELSVMAPLEMYEALYAEYSKSAPMPSGEEDEPTPPLKVEGSFGGSGGSVGNQSPWFRRA